MLIILPLINLLKESHEEIQIVETDFLVWFMSQISYYKYNDFLLNDNY